ncbi:Dynein heavy chain 10, axonemal, partial [Homalodisca vitripennis]
MISNLEKFNRSLNSKSALFSIESVLASPDVVTRPTAYQVYNMIVYCSRDFLDRFKKIPRWMDGTCVRCPSVRTPAGEHLYSFFDDLVRVQKVNELVTQTLDTAHAIGSEIKKYLIRNIFPHTNTNTPELHFSNSRPRLPPLLLVLQFLCSSPASSLTTPLPNLSIII